MGNSQVKQPFRVVPIRGKGVQSLHPCMNGSLDVCWYNLGQGSFLRHKAIYSRGTQLWVVSSQYSSQLGDWVPWPWSSGENEWHTTASTTCCNAFIHYCAVFGCLVCVLKMNRKERGEILPGQLGQWERGPRGMKKIRGGGVRENELREQHTQLLIVGMEDCKQTVIGGEWER